MIIETLIVKSAKDLYSHDLDLANPDISGITKTKKQQKIKDIHYPGFIIHYTSGHNVTVYDQRNLCELWKKVKNQK